MGDRSHQDAIMAVRQEEAEDSEPIVTRTRKAKDYGSGMEVNLTSVGTDIHDIQHGDELDVQIHDDHIRVVPEE
jgi:hypothetical protein